ncbi:MAG: beta-lactamase family protein [Lachnospiraceae bacterium]|nr:beta-lactamase family protein [Lachnospiraceae bacterium]
MKTTIRYILSLAVMTLFLAGCSDKPADYTIVRYENGEVTYENSGSDENSVYELGSNGKTVAAYTALAMVDEGILELDESIALYLDPELITDDARINDITLRELLCHTAGFSPSYELGVDKNIYNDPGTGFCYSGVGYIYLQSVIVNAGGMSMDSAAQKYVFTPLGMKNSTFESMKTVTPYMNLGNAVLYALIVFAASFLILSILALIFGAVTKFRLYKFKTAFTVCFVLAGIVNSIILLFVLPNLSKTYFVFLICFAIMALILYVTRKKSKAFYIVAPVFLIAVILLGSLIPVTVPVTNDLRSYPANVAYTFRSTGEDMALFCNDLMKKYAEDTGAFGEMFDENIVIDDENSWGLGIAIENTEGSGTTYWHSGINPGFQSLYVLYPEEDKYIVVITNSDRGLDFAKETARDYLGINGVWDIKRN